MKLLIKLRFIPKLAEIPSIKFTIKFKQKILLTYTRQEEKSFGEFELDESCFGEN